MNTCATIRNTIIALVLATSTVTGTKDTRPFIEKIQHRPTFLSLALLAAGLAGTAYGAAGISATRKDGELKAFRRYVLRHRVQALFNTSNPIKLRELLHEDETAHTLTPQARESALLYLQAEQERSRNNKRWGGSVAALLAGLAALASAGYTHVTTQPPASPEAAAHETPVDSLDVG